MRTKPEFPKAQTTKPDGLKRHLPWFLAAVVLAEAPIAYLAWTDGDKSRWVKQCTATRTVNRTVTEYDLLLQMPITKTVPTTVCTATRTVCRVGRKGEPCA